MQIATVIATSALAACGAGLWTYAGSSLAANKAFDYTPNPLGIKMSPYGQVIAMAIQAPIDNDWTARLARGRSGPHSPCGEESCDHDHTHGQCGHNTETPPATGKAPLIARLEAAAEERTNPRPPSPAHEFYLRSQVEKRLHFAWSLDPSNYANYHSYHLFLSESSVGTREALQADWIEHGINVARFTIDYCLHENHDPRPSLTAAAAAANALELMLHQKDTRPIADLQQMLATLDHALAKHVELSNAWVESGAWANLSPMRQQEVSDRYTFLLKIREANHGAVQRISERGNRNAEHPSSKPESQTTARNSYSPLITDH